MQPLNRWFVTLNCNNSGRKLGTAFLNLPPSCQTTAYPLQIMQFLFTHYDGGLTCCSTFFPPAWWTSDFLPAGSSQPSPHSLALRWGLCKWRRQGTIPISHNRDLEYSLKTGEICEPCRPGCTLKGHFTEITRSGIQLYNCQFFCKTYL